MKWRVAAAALALLCAAQGLQAVDLWRNPETAGRNTLFVDTALVTLSFGDEGFVLPPPLEIRADYMLPVPVPVSLGVYFVTPDPNLKSFGGRAAFHLDLRNPKIDVYALYAFDLGFLRNDILGEYGDEEQDIHYYDFRIGMRYLFGSLFGISLETGFKLRGVSFALSIKLF